MGKILQFPSRPSAVISFDTLRPLQTVDGFTFCHGSVKPSEEVAAKIRAMVEPRGAGFIQTAEAGRYEHCFAVPAEIAEAEPDFAAGLVIDLVNAGLLVPAYDCAAG